MNETFLGTIFIFLATLKMITLKKKKKIRLKWATTARTDACILIIIKELPYSHRRGFNQVKYNEQLHPNPHPLASAALRLACCV